MKLSINKMIDHRSNIVFSLLHQGVTKTSMLLPGAGCSFGCCCSSCGAMTDQSNESVTS